MLNIFIYLIGYLLSVVVLRADYERDTQTHWLWDAGPGAIFSALIWPVWIPIYYALRAGRELGRRNEEDS